MAAPLTMSKIDYEALVKRFVSAADAVRDQLVASLAREETLTRELAEADRGVCTDCEDTGITIQTERLCTCHAGNAERLARELAEAREDVMKLRRHRMEMDCRFTMGKVADISGSHCPISDPCDRCAHERKLTKARSELTATKARLAEAVGCIQKIANQSKCDEFEEDEREDLDFIGGYGFVIDEARAFLAKQEASHD